MRILPLLVLALGTFAEPWLPKVARTFRQTPNAKIALDWTVVPADGFAPPRTAKGTLKLADGNRFRFESDGLVAVCDGSTLWQWNGSTNQVLVQHASKVDQSTLPAGLLQAALEGSETAAIEDKTDGRILEKLSLDNSRPPLSRFSRAWLWADPSSLKPVRIEVQDSQGNKTVWTLRKISRWKPDAKDFTYSVPAGSDVVDMRK